ncbi:MAG: Uma2 family endonuclease [Acidobacteria bacterium]|nr:Uma2 family endonuclease [Acidobacteriota bacterium]
MLVLDDISAYSSVLLDGPRLTDDEFLSFCDEHDEYRVESTAEGELEIMPLPGPDTGTQNAWIISQLTHWAVRTGRGRFFDCSSTFGLPNGARRAPDAAWISRERASAVPKSERGKIWHVCPEFVIELRSPSDRLSRLRRKMEEWTANGAELAWLVDPPYRRVTIYRPGRDPEVLEAPPTVAGEGPVEGFVLDLALVWEVQAETEET